MEELWLTDRQGPNYSFYKGLIQLAGAFVHLQKNRLKPAAALFKLARANLLKYPAIHERLEYRQQQLHFIANWLDQLESGHFEVNPLTADTLPTLPPAAEIILPLPACLQRAGVTGEGFPIDGGDNNQIRFKLTSDLICHPSDLC